MNKGLHSSTFSAQRKHFLWDTVTLVGVSLSVENESQVRLRSGRMYDKVPEAMDFRALAKKIQLKNLESKDAISIIRRDMAAFDSSILS